MHIILWLFDLFGLGWSGWVGPGVHFACFFLNLIKKISNELEFGMSNRVTMIPMTITMIMMVAIYLSSEEFISRTCRVLGTGVLAVCSPGGLPWSLWFSWLIGCHWSLVLAVCCPGVFHDYYDFHANDMIDCAPLEVISWVSLMTFMLMIQMQLHICTCTYMCKCWCKLFIIENLQYDFNNDE